METLNLRLTVLKFHLYFTQLLNLHLYRTDSSKAEELYYCVSLKTPRKPELLNLIPYHMQKLEYSIKFKTGILATLQHSITLYIFRECNEPKVALFITLEKPKEQIIELRSIEINFSIGNGENAVYSMFRRLPPNDLQIPDQQINVENFAENNQCWIAGCGWPNDSSVIFLTFNIISKYPPEIVNEEEDDLVLLLRSTNDESINVGGYFMNEEFSDFTIICQLTKFPVHRIILSSRVKYFQALFASNMKESQEGKLTIDDISPTTCLELLRFIYQGKVDNLPTCAQELFVIADKYGITDLQGICERYLFRNMSIDNALEVYELSPVLTKKAKEIILRNKDKFAPNAEALKNFTCKYPDLVFELFSLK